MMTYSCSAPGTLMLFGEHAVLRGKQAICCAVDQRVLVELTPRTDNIIHLVSTLGEQYLNLSDFAVTAPFEFVTSSIAHFLPEIKSGFDLKITADFSSTVGLGSSAAVTAATIGVLNIWLKKPIIRLEIFKIVKEVILKVQGSGSGADAAAAIFGGVVSYQLQPLQIQSFPISFPLHLIYSGAKTPTKTVIAWVNEKEKANPVQYEKLFNAMHECSCEAMKVLSEIPPTAMGTLKNLGQLMNEHHHLQRELGVSTPLIEELIAHLCQDTKIYGAKISGSGMGDCVIAVGELSKHTAFPENDRQRQAGVKEISVKISSRGLSLGEMKHG